MTNFNKKYLHELQFHCRSHFNDMWQKMVNKLEQGKKYIVELIDQSTTAYDQREELCNKIQTLKEKNQSESGIHKQVRSKNNFLNSFL